MQMNKPETNQVPPAKPPGPLQPPLSAATAGADEGAATT